MSGLLDKVLIVYNVNVQSVSTGCRIEGFSCKSYMFLDYEKAMDFAFDLAKEYALTNKTMPGGYSSSDEASDEDSDKKSETDEFDIDKLERFGSYRWPDKEYGCWDEYSIHVYYSSLNFNNDIIHRNSFSD